MSIHELSVTKDGPIFYFEPPTNQSFGAGPVGMLIILFVLNANSGYVQKIWHAFNSFLVSYTIDKQSLGTYSINLKTQGMENSYIREQAVSAPLNLTSYSQICSLI
jgi:hypothetical protein